MKAHPTNDASAAWQTATASIVNQFQQDKRTIQNLLCIIQEEFTTNGGHFASMESDTLFKRMFWHDTCINHDKAFERLRDQYK